MKVGSFRPPNESHMLWRAAIRLEACLMIYMTGNCICHYKGLAFHYVLERMVVK